MNDSAIPTPTAAELEILQVLWEKHPESVRFVNEAINRRRAPDQKELGYTTTLKQMQVMLDKGLLVRDVVDKNHLYRPALNRETTQTRVISDLANLAFNGSASSLVLRVLGSGQTTPEELAQIKELIQSIENQQNKAV